MKYISSKILVRLVLVKVKVFLCKNSLEASFILFSFVYWYGRTRGTESISQLSRFYRVSANQNVLDHGSFITWSALRSLEIFAQPPPYFSCLLIGIIVLAYVHWRAEFRSFDCAIKKPCNEKTMLWRVVSGRLYKKEIQLTEQNTGIYHF